MGIRNFALLLACTASYAFFSTMPQSWLRSWTTPPASQRLFYISVYSRLSLMAWISTNGSMWSTQIRIAPASGIELHSRLLRTVAAAPLSFFSANDAGAILNRFSQDMQLVDKSLPPAILAISNQVFKMIVQASLLFSVQPMMALSLPLCGFAIYVVQKAYLRTTRQLRVLDLESTSRMYSNFLESVWHTTSSLHDVTENDTGRRRCNHPSVWLGTRSRTSPHTGFGQCSTTSILACLPTRVTQHCSRPFRRRYSYRRHLAGIHTPRHDIRWRDRHGLECCLACEQHTLQPCGILDEFGRLSGINVCKSKF